MKSTAELSKLRLAFAKEVVSLASETQRLNANLQRVFGNYRSERGTPETETEFDEMDAVEVCEQRTNETLLRVRKMFKELAQVSVTLGHLS